MGKTREEIVNLEKEEIVEQISLGKLFQACKEAGYACAIYRHPRSTQRHVIIDTSGAGNLDNLHVEEMGSGFIFHPFSTEEHKIKFIAKDIHIVEDLSAGTKDIHYFGIDQDALHQLLQTDIAKAVPRRQAEDSSISPTVEERQKSNFIDLVEKTLGEIRSGNFQKVVVSRRKKITLTERFDSFQFFEVLQERYINAFIYLTYIPGIGEWLGATPETLISIDKNREFRTVALAATQAYSEDNDLEDTTWSQKDIEEQAMVSRYIINCFKKIRLREFEEIGPRTYLSGNLVHLKTDYIVDMDQVAFPQLGSVMLELLHPTSAVCGMPKESSMDFIRKNEGFDREYFSGFLGPVNVLEETSIFVNLRCMKLLNGSGYLFAGAGIISNSNPEKEWIETKIKMDTLQKVLDSNS